MEFSRQEYWSELPCPPPGDIPDQGIKSMSPAYIYIYISNGKESACNAGDQGTIPGLGSSSGEGNGNPLQYSCLEDSVDRETWRALVCGVAKSWT